MVRRWLLVLKESHPGRVDMKKPVTYLDGTPQRTYPTKKTTKAIEYLFEFRSRSVSIPAISALPILCVREHGQLAVLFGVKKPWQGWDPCWDLHCSDHVRQQVHAPNSWQQKEIDLPHQSLLLFGVGHIVVDGDIFLVLGHVHVDLVVVVAAGFVSRIHDDRPKVSEAEEYKSRVVRSVERGAEEAWERGRTIEKRNHGF